jgi:hypothetical protein
MPRLPNEQSRHLNFFWGELPTVMVCPRPNEINSSHSCRVNVAFFATFQKKGIDNVFIKGFFCAMKQVLSLLVAFVFLQVQSWALSGGPVYPGNGASVSGTYAGTIVGEVFFNATGGLIPTTTPTVAANGMGVFQIGQPTTGLGSGVFAMFAGGSTYTGSVVAIGDPTELTMTGVMEGDATVTESAQVVNLVTGVVTQAPFQFTEGIIGVSFTTTISFDQSGATGGSTSTRITGSGAANYQGVDQTTGALFPLGSSTLIIDGFLQSNTVSGQIDLNTLTQTQGAGSGTN